MPTTKTFGNEQDQTFEEFIAGKQLQGTRWRRWGM